MTAHLRVVPDPPKQEQDAFDLPAAICKIDAQIEELYDQRQWILANLFEQYGRKMLADGQRTKIVNGYKLHCAPPRIKEYCTCCHTLLYQCLNDPADRPGTYERLDSRPDFWIRKVGE